MRDATKRHFAQVRELPELNDEPLPEQPKGTVRVIVLASGSKGNAIILAYGKRALLVDAGISPKEIGDRSRAVGCPLTSWAPKAVPGNACAVEAVLLTHWHSDHKRCLSACLREFNASLICSTTTHVALESQSPRFRPARDGECLDGEWYEVFPLKVPHEQGSLVFHVRIGGKNIVIAHDLAEPTSALFAAARAADCLLIEANHDPRMIAACTNPDHPAELHAHILSNDRGHLSNSQAAEVVSHVDPSRIQAVCITHVSDSHNTEQEAEEVIRGSIPEGARPQVYVARQDSPLLIEVNGGPSPLALSIVENYRILDHKVDAIIEEQKRANLESSERFILMGEYMVEMQGLFESKEPGTKLEGFDFFTAWKESKAVDIGYSIRMLDYAILDAKVVVAQIGRDEAKKLPIATISELGKLAKAKGTISTEILQYAQEHPSHEVKAKVASVLYPGHTGHFDGKEDFLSITAGKEKVKYLRQLIDQARPYVGVEAPDHEVIEYALKHFIDWHEDEEKIKAAMSTTDSPVPPPPDISDLDLLEDLHEPGKEAAEA